MSITIKLLGKQHTTNTRSMLSLAPLLRFVEDGGKSVEGWYGAAYCLVELLQFNPPLPQELVWYKHLIVNGEEQKRYGINLTEHELVYIIQTITEELQEVQNKETLIGEKNKEESKNNVTAIDGRQGNIPTNPIFLNSQKEQEQQEIQKQIEELQKKLVTQRS